MTRTNRETRARFDFTVASRLTEERDFFCAAANNQRSRSYEMSSLSFGHSFINLP